MKIFRYIQSCFLLLSIGVLASCFDDKGNYEYDVIGEAVIKSIPGVTDQNNKFVCLENGKISLTPELEFLAGTTAADYEFIWYRYPQDPQGTSFHYEQGDTLAMTQNLEYQVVNTPRDYWLVYKVRNKKTGALTEQKFEFIISSVNGWIVLDEDAAGNGDLQIIRDADVVSGGDGRIVKNYFSANNKGEKMKNTRFMGLCGSESNLYVFSDNGGYIMNASTYEQRADMTYMDLFNPNVVLDRISPEAEYYDSKGGNTDIIINDRKVYKVSHKMMGESSFIEPGGDVSDFLLAPVIAPIRVSGNDNCAALFDVKNNRFMTVGTWGALSVPMSTGGAFNTGKIDPEFDFVYMNEGKDGETCLLMNKVVEDAEAEPYLFRANLVTETPVALDMYNLSGLEDVKNAEHYVFGIRGNFMFYATETKVYTWRYGNERSSDFLTVGAGERIVQMKLYVNPADNVFSGKIMFIATRKGNEGKVYKVVFNEMSGVLLNEPQVYEGLGIIKDMFFKE